MKYFPFKKNTFSFWNKTFFKLNKMQTNIQHLPSCSWFAPVPKWQQHCGRHPPFYFHDTALKISVISCFVKSKRGRPRDVNLEEARWIMEEKSFGAFWFFGCWFAAADVERCCSGSGRALRPHFHPPNAAAFPYVKSVMKLIPQPALIHTSPVMTHFH